MSDLEPVKRLVTFLVGFLSGSMIIGGLIERMFLSNWADGGPIAAIFFGILIGVVSLIIMVAESSE